MAAPDPFIELFASLPRQGPGDRECALRALEAARPHLPEHPVVLDLGCGSGAGTAVLAHELAATIFAIDKEPALLERLRVEVPHTERSVVLPILADFRRLPEGLPVDAVPADLIWSEGAAYNLTFEGALQAWGPLLGDGGVLVLSECCWLSDERDPQAQALFEVEYPAMLPSAELELLARDHGWQVLAAFDLPDEAWWDAFYEPLQARIAHLRGRWDQAEGRRVLDGAQAEIDLWRRTKDCWGYRFVVLRRPTAG
jgi:SAM-dependent methyltransferase